MSKFFRGKSNLFNPERHKDGLFFATNINELYVALKDGSYRTYGSKEIITNISFDAEKTELILTYRDNVIPVVGENGEVTSYTNTASVSLSSLLDVVTDEKKGLMSSTDKANLDTLVSAYENNELGKVQGVAADNVLDLSSDGILSASVSLNYDENDKSIKLFGKNNAVLGSVDASPFIKDGMLQDVEIITVEEEITTGEGDEAVTETISKKYIEFTWNVTVETEVEGEKVETTKTDRIAVDELVISYTAGNGILINDSYEISIKLAESSEENPNFLELDNNGLKMSEITTDATVLQRDIVVAGLKDTLGTGNYTNGTTIPAGTSIYEILTKILSQEIYPSDAKMSNTGGLVSSYGKPTFTLTNSGSTVEVGTAATVSGVTGYNPTESSTSRQYSGFTNGYSVGDDDSVDSAGNPPSVPVSDITLLDGTFTLTRTYTGFGLTGAALTTSSNSSEAASNCVINEDSTLIVHEGTNSVEYKMEGPGHYGKIVNSPIYYIVSNLGNTSSNKYVSAVDEKTISNSTATAGAKTLSVTGAFKYYIGYVTAVPTDIEVEGDAERHATAAIKSMTDFTPSWCSSSEEGNIIESGGTLPAGKTMCIAVPNHYELSSIMNGFDLESVNSFATTTVKYKLANETYKDYTIYSMSSAADWKFKTIKITKIKA